MEKDIEKFTSYVNDNYDINNKLIKEKYDHSIRVSMLMIDLALRLNLDDNDIYLAFLIGLFHDLGRFREVVRNNRFDNLTFDHGAYSNKILFNDGFINNYNVSKEDYLVVKKAIYFHNKKDIDKPLNEKEMLYAKMIRDMDKLDIISVMIKKGILNFNNTPNKIVLSNYFTNDTIDLKSIKSKTDLTILYLSFIRDLNFNESHDMAIERRDLNKIVSGVKPSFDNEELYNHLIDNVSLSNDKDKCYVKK